MSDITDIEKVTFVVRGDSALVEGLDRAAAKRGISRNTFVLKALNRVLDGESAS